MLATIAKRAGIVLGEAVFTRDDLSAADEVFLTASTVEILPVVRVAGRRIGDGKPGAITRAMQERYRRFVDAALARETSRAPA